MGIAIMTWIDTRHYSRDLRDIARNGLGGSAYERYRIGFESLSRVIPAYAVNDHLGATIAQVAIRDRKIRDNPHVQRMPGTAEGMMEISVARDAFLFERSGRQVFEFTPALAEELAITDVDDVMPYEIQLPYDAFYVRVPGLPDMEGSAIEGLLMSRMQTAYGPTVNVRPMAVDQPNGRPGRDFASANISLSGDRPVVELLVAQDERMKAFRDARPLGEMTQKYGTEMDAVSESIDGESERARMMLASIQSTAINVLLYIDNCSRHMRRTWPSDAPADDVAKAEAGTVGSGKAEQRLTRNGWTKVTLCQLEAGAGPMDDGGSNGTRRLVRAHMRRGHWRRQRHGPGAKLVKRIRIRPSLIGAGSGTGEVGGRTYDVR